MSKTVYIQITTAGEDTCLLDLYSDSDGCSVPIVTNVSVEDLIDGYLLEVPDDADEICVRSETGVTCDCGVNLRLVISGTPPPSNPLPSPTPTITPTPTHYVTDCSTPLIINVTKSGPSAVLIVWGYYTDQCDGYVVEFSRNQITWSGSTGDICVNPIILYVGDSTGQWCFRIKQLCFNGEESEYSPIFCVDLGTPAINYVHNKLAERDCSNTFGNITVDGIVVYSWSWGMDMGVVSGTTEISNGSVVKVMGQANPPLHCYLWPDTVYITYLTISITGDDTFYEQVNSADGIGYINHTFTATTSTSIITIISGNNQYYE